MHRNWRFHLSTYFKEMSACMKTMCIIPEYTLSGNIHYHGWFQLLNQYKWYKQTLPKLKNNGFVKIDYANRFKVHDYGPEENALYYYKKEVIRDSYLTSDPPLVSKTYYDNLANKEFQAQIRVVRPVSKARPTILKMFALNLKDEELIHLNGGPFVLDN